MARSRILNGFFSLALIAAVVALLSTGCARPKPLARPSLDTPVSFDVAVRMIAFDLFAQISNQQKLTAKRQLPTFETDTSGKIGKVRVKKQQPGAGDVPTSFMADVIMNADTGEEIELNKQILELIQMTATNSFPSYSVVEINSENVNQANFVIIGVIKNEIYNNQTTKLPHLFLSAVDMKNSQVMAHSEVWISNQDMKFQPTALYSDSPMFLKDPRAEKVIATARAAAGSVVDSNYFSTMETNGLLTEASTAYNSGDYPLAVELFSKVARRDDGQVMKTYAGLYQAYFKLRQLTEAEAAFAKLTEIGIKNGTLSVKFLFQVGDTSFFGSSEQVAEYDIWLRQISRKIAESQSCVEISGHASHSGSADFNKKLSDKRAHTIQKRLLEVSPVIAKNTVAIGRGFEENIVGSGTDDIRDAIDRRVEFKVLDCSKM
ncbi:MAG: OmpA family protein [Pseudomonadota bacterium]